MLYSVVIIGFISKTSLITVFFSTIGGFKGVVYNDFLLFFISSIILLPTVGVRER